MGQKRVTNNHQQPQLLGTNTLRDCIAAPTLTQLMHLPADPRTQRHTPLLLLFWDAMPQGSGRTVWAKFYNNEGGSWEQPNTSLALNWGQRPNTIRTLGEEPPTTSLALGAGPLFLHPIH